MVKVPEDLKKLGVWGGITKTGHWQWRFFSKRTWREQKPMVTPEVTPEAPRLYIPYHLLNFCWNFTVFDHNFPNMFPLRYRLDYSRPGGLGPRPPEIFPVSVGTDEGWQRCPLVGHCYWEGSIASQWIFWFLCCVPKGGKHERATWTLQPYVTRIATKDNFIS